MAVKRKKDLLAVPAAAPEVSGEHRTVLTMAYKAGLILSWKRDIEHGYCVTRAGRPDEYVEVGKLASYLEKLKGAA